MDVTPNSVLRDLRYALRMLARSPGLTAVLVITLALGIGANTTIFSIVDGILLRPVPAPHANQLMAVTFQARDKPQNQPQLSYLDYQDVRAGTKAAFSGIAVYTFGIDGIKAGGATERIVTNYVSGNYFDVLQLKAAAGRLFLPTEGSTPGADPVIVLGYSYWQRHFGGSTAIIGQRVDVDGHPLTIIGVAPRGFPGLVGLVDIQAYLPLAMGMELEPSGFVPAFLTDRGQRALLPIARLADGVTPTEAKAAARVVGTRLAATYPKSNQNLDLTVIPMADYKLGPGSQSFTVIAALFLTLAGLVLLLACVNVANLLLVRAGARKQEMAVRAALGAGRSRLVRQMLTESLLVSLVGGAAGLGLGVAAARALDHIHITSSFPVLLDFGFDLRVFFFSLLAAILTGLAAGLLPALRASGGHLNPMLQSGARVIGGRQWVRSSLVVAQVAGSLVLLAAYE